jgi:hypothetical protein
MPAGEMKTPYYSRPEGSVSKLNTWRDGVRILKSLSPAVIAVGLAIPIFVTYVHEGVVPRLPTAVLSTGLMVLAFLSICCGVVLDTVTRGRRELKLLAYLAQRAPAEERRRS